MKQLTFSALEHGLKKKKTRKDIFLEEMEQVVPWNKLLALIEPHYPVSGKRGRPPKELAAMFRIYCLQQWFNLSDPAAEEALYDSEAMRRFAGVSLLDQSIPDETTILNFRHLLESHGLQDELFKTINRYLEAEGLLLRQGTVVDATLIHAPSSTKNRDKKRDPEMSSTRKNNQWYFGMKAHIGVDSDSGLVHNVVTTTAKVHDAKVIDDLLHGEEQGVLGDKAYTSKERSIFNRDSDVTWGMPIKKPKGRELEEWEKEINRRLSSLRAIVEHPFHTLKCVFGYRKTRYRGLEKNNAQLMMLFGLGNLHRVRKSLLA